MPQCKLCGEIVGAADIKDDICLKCIEKYPQRVKEIEAVHNPFVLYDEDDNTTVFKYAELFVFMEKKGWTVFYGGQSYDYSEHFHSIMDKVGDMGWELVSVTPLSDSESPWLTYQVFVSTGGLIYTFKKSIQKNQALAK